ALMLIGPYVPGGLRIAVTTRLVSRPYLQITKSVMADFGPHAVTIDGHSVIYVGPGKYRSRDYTIEPDASSASYPLAAAAICGGRVEVPDLTSHAVQGDARFCDVRARMGCAATRGDGSTIVESGERLDGVDIDMVEMS